jgi:hypothetical protein
MKDVRLLCDICGKPGALPVALTGDSYMDAAGATAHHYMAFDVCAECGQKMLSKTLSGLDEMLLQSLLDSFKWKSGKKPQWDR